MHHLCLDVAERQDLGVADGLERERHARVRRQHIGGAGRFGELPAY